MMKPTILEWYCSWKDFAITLIKFNVATDDVEDCGFYGTINNFYLKWATK